MSKTNSHALRTTVEKEIDQSWYRELSKRVSDVDSGKVTMQPRDKVMEHARKRLARIR